MARQSFKPTDALRAKVRHLSGVGVLHDDIAKIAECSPKTLRKHFRRELGLGAAEANAMMGGYLYQNGKDGNVAAQIFWMKCRARWKESPPGESAADDGASASDTDTDKLILERMAARFQRLTKKENDNEHK